MADSSDEEVVDGASVLEEIPGRVLTFLRGIANSAAIYGLLADAGFKSEDYQQGWALLHAAAGYTPDVGKPPAKSAAFGAMQELDNWDEDGFRRVRAALGRLHKPQAEFVFAGGLAASSGPAAVLGVKTLLDRLDALENDNKERKATRKEDHAALETLDGRGITKAERDRLRALVDTAQTLDEPAALPASTAEERQEALVTLYGWYKDWTETARSVVKKRSNLITLGLAKRKAAKAAKAEKPAKTEKPAGPEKPPVS